MTHPDAPGAVKDAVAKSTVGDPISELLPVSEPASSPRFEDGEAERMPRFRFIPFRRSDLLRMLRAEALLKAAELELFEHGIAQTSLAFAREFHDLRENFKEHYASLDPDADTRAMAEEVSPDGDAEVLLAELATLLDRGNYERLDDDDLRRAFRSASLFQIRLRVDLKAFDDVLIYTRGAKQCEESISYCFGLLRRRLNFVSFDRVVLYLRFADRDQGDDSQYPPGRVMIKLFQNVPDADMEMLFPNTRVGMRWSDRLLIGVPALVSGIVVATTKLGAPLLLLGALIGFWLGLHGDAVALDKKGLLLIGAGLGAVGAYVYKQWSTYKNRKARFRQALTRDLYFKLLDNNAGVLLRVLDDAEDGECKEAYVALYFLLSESGGMQRDVLDQAIERWFAQRWSATIDFEIDDALDKLAQLGLAVVSDNVWRAVVPTTGDTAA
ncbi:MAG: TMEM143 family protein [Congregibacter sp.]